MTKITKEKLEKMRKYWKSGASFRDVSRKFDVPHSTAYYWLTLRNQKNGRGHD